MPQTAQFQVFLQTLAEMLAADRERKTADRQQQSRVQAHRFLNRSAGGTKMTAKTPDECALPREG